VIFFNPSFKEWFMSKDDNNNSVKGCLLIIGLVIVVGILWRVGTFVADNWEIFRIILILAAVLTVVVLVMRKQIKMAFVRIADEKRLRDELIPPYNEAVKLLEQMEAIVNTRKNK